jgi:hypothetical protein
MLLDRTLMRHPSRWMLVVLVAAGAMSCGGATSRVSASQSSVGIVVGETLMPTAPIVADGITTATLTAVARDALGRRLVGRTVLFRVGGSGNHLAATAVNTAGDGSASVALSSKRAEVKEVAVEIDGVEVQQRARVIFVAGPAAQLAFAVQPTTHGLSEAFAAGEVFETAVQVQDANGNLASSSAVVTVVVGGGTLRGTTSATAVNGIASFDDLSVNEAGPSYTLQASAPGIASATSVPFTVVAGAAAQIAFGTQPTDTVAGAIFSPPPDVRLQDAYGNTVFDANGNTVFDANGVMVDLLGGNPGATLRGTASCAASGGAFSCPGLSIQEAGAGYTLVASYFGLTVASSTFAVNAAAADASRSTVLATPPSVVAGGTLTLTATLRDAYGNPVPNQLVAFSATGSANVFGLPPATDVNGTTTATLSSTTAEVKSVTAAAVAYGAPPATGVTFIGNATTVFTVGAPSAATSVVTITPAVAKADGISSAAVRVIVKDQFGNAVPGAQVTLTTDGDAISISQPPWTDASGAATGLLTSTAAVTQTITACAGAVTIGVVQAQFCLPAGVAALTGPTTVLNGSLATFTVTASGSPPFVFVWARNGAYIDGTYLWTLSNSATYTTPPLTQLDNGASYAVTVYDQVSSVTAPAWTVSVVDPLPGQQLCALYSDEPELYPQRGALKLTSTVQTASGAGVTFGLAYTGGGMPLYDFTASGDAAVSADTANTALTVLFGDPTLKDLQSGTVIFSSQDGGQGGPGPASIVISYKSPAWLMAHGQSGPARLAISEANVPASSTEVEDWLVQEPSADDVAFAWQIWGGAIAGLASPTTKAQAIARALIDQLEPHRGVPSDAMNTAPFAQYRRAMAGQDYVWCVNITAIFVWACKSLGVPARIVALGNVAYGSAYNLETAEGHATAEIFDDEANRWVWIDPTLYQLGMRGPGGRLLDLVEAQRAVNDRDLFQGAIALEYVPAGSTSELALGQASHARDIAHFLTSASTPAFTKASGLRLAREFHSNEAALFPRQTDLGLRDVQPLSDGYGARLRLVSSLPGFDHFEYMRTASSDATAQDVVHVSLDGVIDVSFDNPHSPLPRSQVYMVRAVTAPGAFSTQYDVIVKFYSTEFYRSYGQSSFGYVVVDPGLLQYASSVVQDWIVDVPSEDDVTFATATWGSAFDPKAGPVTQAQTIGAAILDQVGGAIGVPTDDMAAATPFEQYRRAAVGVDQMDSAGLAALYAHALNGLGLMARIVAMGRTIASGADLIVDAAPRHAAVELFDAVDNRWVYLDLSLGILGVTQDRIGLLNSAKLSRAAVDPSQIGTLTVLVYDATARVQRVPFTTSAAGASVANYFQLGPLLRFTRNGDEVARLERAAAPD